MAAVMAEYATVEDALSRAEQSPSRAGRVASPSRQFKVKNVDTKGRIIHVGYLEVSEVGVTFTFEHYPSEVIHWPLKCIRKYGVNAADGVFAVEVGRHAATGEGRYAFRAEDAEDICRSVDYVTGTSNVGSHFC